MKNGHGRLRGVTDGRCWQALVEGAARARRKDGPYAPELAARVRVLAATASAEGLDLLALTDTSREAYDLVELICGAEGGGPDHSEPAEG